MSNRSFRLRGAALSVAAWAACAIVAVHTAIPAGAADRVVLCEEFSNRW